MVLEQYQSSKGGFGATAAAQNPLNKLIDIRVDE
jgi:hypothetical protein